MSANSHALERCRAFIDSNFVKSPEEEHRTRAAVTISRQDFSGSHEIAELMIRELDADSELGRRNWALFDRDLVLKILEDHDLPKSIARYMPEDKDRDVSGLINELVGLHPSLWQLFHYTCDTIHKLAKKGNVILIGRGAHIIARDIPHVMHVRIVAPLEQRVQRAAKLLQISTGEAERKVHQEDQARAAFVRSHFDEALDNTFAYHLTINTGRTSLKAAASIICTALRQR